MNNQLPLLNAGSNYERLKRFKVGVFGPYGESEYHVREIVFFKGRVHQTRLIKRVFNRMEAYTNAKAHADKFKREFIGEMS